MPKEKSKGAGWIEGKAFPYLLLIGGILCIFAAIMLSIDRIKILEDPSFRPECSINPIIACGPVMSSPEGKVFGFPNPFLGLVAYALVANLGALMLAKVILPRWYWLAFNGGMLFSVLFVHWLIQATLYDIGAICLYCSLVWVVTIPIFWYTTLYNLKKGYLPTPRSLKGVVSFAQKHHFDILIVWYLIIIGLVLNRFWYYWSTLI